MTEDSHYVSQGPCPKCPSEHRFTKYTDGHYYCHKCGYYVDSDGNESDQQKKPMSFTPLELEYVPLISRKISQATCEKFKYGVTADGTQVENHFDVNGNLVAQKLKHKPGASKRFSWNGDSKSAALFGQHLFKPNPKTHVIVTEGAVDCLSVYEACGKGYPVVSVNNGASSAAKEIAQQLDWLEGFRKVILMFDSDGPGQKAAQECLRDVLSYGKGESVKLPLKDASEMLMAGRVAELVKSQWQGVGFRPKGVFTCADVAEDAKKPPEWGLSWPWETLTKGTNGSNGTFGIRKGEIYGYGAGTGVGKSTAMWHIATHLAAQHGQKVGIVPFESRPADSLLSIASVAAGKPFYVPDGNWTQEQREDAIESVSKSNRFFFAGSFEDASWDEVKSRVRYLVKVHEVEHVFLDNLTAVVASEEDENKALKRIMKEMAVELAEGLDISFHYLSHLTPPDGKSHEEGCPVRMRDFRGSRTIGFWSHFVFGIEGNTQDPETKNKRLWRVLKDRKTGRSNGLTFGLEYDEETGLLSEERAFEPVTVGAGEEY